MVASRPPSANWLMPTVLGTSTHSKASMYTPRYQRCTAAGSSPASSAKLPMTMRRWMWWAYACSSDWPTACCRQRMRVLPDQNHCGSGVVWLRALRSS
ncbi:hypothetical protein D3C72_1986710 [compost metagenome]